jgi:hypothetical protein
LNYEKKTINNLGIIIGMTLWAVMLIYDITQMDFSAATKDAVIIFLLKQYI